MTLASLSVRPVMLDVQADQHNCWTLEKAGDGTSAAGYAERIELFSCGRFDHALQFFKVKTGVPPELRQFERLEPLQHLGSSLADRQFGGHYRLIE